MSLSSVVVIDDEGHHVVGGVTDGLHGEGRESVWEHSTDQETGELGWTEDVDGAVTDSGDESTEEGETDEASRSDGETLTNSGGSVTGGIEGISLLSNGGWESRHLSNTTGVIRDWSISINGKSNWEGSEHTEGSKTNSVHTGNGESVSDGGGNGKDWDNNGGISESESEDNVWGWSVSASISKGTGWAVGVGGVVFSDESNDHARPESEHDASISLPSGNKLDEENLLSISSNETLIEIELEGLWKDVKGWDNSGGHQKGGDTDLGLEDSLDVLNSNFLDMDEED